MTGVKSGDTVKIEYSYRLQQGNLLDTPTGRKRIQFTLGDGTVIPGIEEAVIGMSPGESTTVDVPAEKAYGPRREDRVFAVDLHRLPQHMGQPYLGQKLKLRPKNGKPVSAIVTGLSKLSVRLDANHPLTGQDLVFDIKLVEIA